MLSPKTAVSRPAAATHDARRGSRPITDRVKESLFNVLGNYGLPTRSTSLSGASSGQGGKLVADLFCGVGSLGLEALSRGAEFVTFVEQDQEIITILDKNIEKAGFVKDSKVIRANAFKIGAPVDPDGQKYNIVFVDPPYVSTRDVQTDSPLGGLLDLLGGQVAADGVVVVRTSRDSFLQEQYGIFKVIERRQWGTMAVTILRKK